MSEKKYTVVEGDFSFYLMSPDGFTLAADWGHKGDALQQIADQLNRLEALERSHAELVEALRECERYFSARNLRQTADLLCGKLQRIIAQSLISPTKTPTAAPHGQ